MGVPRLVLYGIGQYGQMMVRLAVKKGWPIVAAFNRAGPKIGKDVGRLAGLERDYGVVVQDCDVADYALLHADVGIVTLYDTLKLNAVAHRRLLAAGINVICHGTESYFPQMADAALAHDLDQLAKAKGVTFTGTGVWDMSRIWSALTTIGVCDEIRSIRNHSLTILDPFGERILAMAGVGRSPENFYNTVGAEGSAFGGHFYRFGPALVLDALGFTVIECSHRQEPVVAERAFHCRALGRDIAAGQCAGLRAIAEVKTREGISATVAAESRVRFSDTDVEHTLWEIQGEPLSPKVRVERDNGHYMHALSVFNRITDIIAAPPGIQLISRLGPMRPLSVQ